MRSWVVLLGLGFGVAQWSVAQPAAESRAWLEKVRLAHGGAATRNVRTYREIYSMQASVLGVGVYNVKVNYLIDYPENRAYFDMAFNNETQFRVLVSLGGTFAWTKKEGTQRRTDGAKRDGPFGVDAPFHAGVIGALGLEQLKGKLVFDASDQIENLKGVSITREMDNDMRLKFLFAADGTLIAERTFSDKKGTDKKGADMALLYTKYKTVSGIKFPVEARIVSSQIPGIASASFRVDTLEVNAGFDANEFKLP